MNIQDTQIHEAMKELMDKVWFKPLEPCGEEYLYLAHRDNNDPWEQVVLG